MKNKNPLYVVKGKNVEEAHSIFDLIIKKLDLEEAITVLKNIFSLLLAQIQTYAVFESVINFFKRFLEASSFWTGRTSVD